jgi:transcriptional regulator of nitric oxide reductase
MLVGLDMRGVVAGVMVADHHEPYGYFSVDTKEFSDQFKGKSVRDPFRVGEDVQAISRATLTVSSATRAIRNSARRIATAFVPPPDR